MAQPALVQWKPEVLAIATADASLTSSANTILMNELNSGLDVTQVEDNAASAYLGSKESAPVVGNGFVEGGFRLSCPTAPGHATNGVHNMAPLLKPAALAQTLTALSRVTRYNPVSSSFALADVKFWKGGVLRSLTDCSANITGLTMAIGDWFKGSARIEGTSEVITDVSIPTDGVLTAFIKPTVATNENSVMYISSLGSAAISSLKLWGKSLAVDFGNEVTSIEYTSQKQTAISDRLPTFTATFAKPAMADFNPETLTRTGELITMFFKTSETDGRYSKLYVRGQILTVAMEGPEGKANITITGKCIPSSSGGDEFYVEFGDDTFALNGTLLGGVNGALSPSYTFTASGVYTAPLHTWSVFSGALPTGLSINISTGAITGTFGAAGSFTFVIKVKDTDAGTDLEAVTSSQTVVVTA